jgi:hypothetical protein
MVRSDGFYNRAWAEKCIQFNEDVKTYLAVTPSVRTVVLASVFSQYMSGTDLIERATAPVGEASEKFRKTAGSEVLAIQALARTIQDIRSMGRKVVLMAPPPSALGVNFGRCLERKATGKLIFGAGLPSCAIPRNAYGKGPVASFLVRAESDLDVPIFRPDKFLCHDDICDVEMDGVFLYRDNGHLSYDGSRLLAKKLDLAGQLIRMAR